MDVVLLTLTTLSLAAAAGFGALSWRVGREERERSRARVAALATAMDPTSSVLAGPTPADPGPRVAVGAVFERSGERLRGRPVIKAAVGAVMAMAIVAGAIIGARSGGTPAAQSAGSAPLELLSMRYQREGTTLTVSGLVHNPAAGAAVIGLTAVVFAFDRNGGFVASGRAPLDFSALAPGDESPFVVAVPNVSDVARYRVSFRTDRGVVRHVDRRGDHVQLAQAVR
jgi:predicted permease